MRKLLSAGLLAALALLLFLAVGCSDDDETTAPVTKEIGDVNDPEYVAAMDAVDDADEFADFMFNVLFAAIDTVMAEAGYGSAGHHYADVNSTGIEADSIFEVLTYHAATAYWYHHRYARIELASDTLISIVTDSIQFLHAAGPVQWPDTALLQGINHGVRFELSDTDVQHIIAQQQLALLGDLVHEGDVTANGSQMFDVALGQTNDSCSLDLDLNTTVTGIALNIAHVDAGGCPESGVIRHTGSIVIACSGTPAVTYDDSWTVTETFTGSDNYSLVAENSTTRWTYSGSCAD